MPRNRNKSQAPTNTATETPGTTNTTNVVDTKGSRTMAGLTPEQISALLGKTRQKGVYTVYLKQFIESGEAGICVNETWADMTSKKAQTLKQGFENAKDSKEAPEGSELVKVISSKDEAGNEFVYLVNLKAAGVAVAAAAE